MTLSGARLRDVWGPHCQVQLARVELHGEGTVAVRTTIVDAVLALSRCLQDNNYETRSADTGGYNCRAIRGATDWSLHAYGIAIDINWTTNPFSKPLYTDMPRPMTDAITSIRTNSGELVWRWGGDFKKRPDPMHFEICTTPAAIASGIRVTTVPQPAASPTPDEVRRWNAGILRNQVGGLPDLRPGERTLSVAVLRNALQFVTSIELTTGRTDEQRVVYGADLTQAVASFQRFFNVAHDPPGSFLNHSRLALYLVLEAVRAGR